MGMPETLTLKSGVELQLNIASLEEGHRLLRVVSNEMKQVQIDLDKLDLTMDMSKLGGREINVFKNAACQLIGSDQVFAALKPCMARCLYAGQKAQPDLFEDAKAREDFLAVAWEVIRFNLSPFFRGLNFRSSAQPDPKSAGPQ